MIALTATIPAYNGLYVNGDKTKELLCALQGSFAAALSPSAAALSSPAPGAEGQYFRVGASPGGIHTAAHSDLPGVQLSASAQIPTRAASQLNETLFQGWTANVSNAAVNEASMDARKQTKEYSPEYLPADKPKPHELRAPMEQIAPPEPAWTRARPRKPNVLTDAQKKNIYRKMPQGWEPLADNEIWHLTPEVLHNITGAHITTCRRWLRHPPPELVVRLVCILIGGDLGAIHEQWRGWKIGKRGELVSPELWEFTPGRVRSVVMNLGTTPNRRALDEAREREREAVEALDRLRQVDFIEGRYVEPDEHKLTDAKVEQMTKEKQRAIRHFQEDVAMGRIPDDERTLQLLQEAAHEQRQLQELQTSQAHAVQARPGADDEERERERKSRYYYWRERDRRNTAYPGGSKR